METEGTERLAKGEDDSRLRIITLRVRVRRKMASRAGVTWFQVLPFTHPATSMADLQSCRIVGTVSLLRAVARRSEVRGMCLWLARGRGEVSGLGGVKRIGKGREGWSGKPGEMRLAALGSCSQFRRPAYTQMRRVSESSPCRVARFAATGRSQHEAPLNFTRRCIQTVMSFLLVLLVCPSKSAAARPLLRAVSRAQSQSSPPRSRCLPSPLTASQPSPFGYQHPSLANSSQQQRRRRMKSRGIRSERSAQLMIKTGGGAE